MANEILLFSLIILVGVIGNILFRKTRIPESLFLIGMGLLIGPGLGLVSREFFIENISFFLTFSLVVVLLNGGLNLDLRRTLKNMRQTLIFTVLVLACTIAMAAALLHFALDWPVLNGLFIGVILSGTTTVTITHLVEKLRGKKSLENSANILVIESIVNDITVIAGASIIVALSIPGAITAGQIVQTLFNELVVSLLLGLCVGVALVFLYAYRLEKNNLSYILTVGLALLLYAATEFLGLNGAVAVITTSILLGNYSLVLLALKKLHLQTGVRKAVVSIKKTDTEFTFLIRTFFFVLLGIIFDPAAITQAIVVITVVLLVGKFLARYIASLFLGMLDKEFRSGHLIRTTLVANGFTSTLAAFLAVEAGIAIPNLAEIVLLLVIITTITAIISTAIHHSVHA